MEGEASPHRVLIADDHHLIREGLRAMLDGEPDIAVVGEAADGEEALRMNRFSQPDLIVMDIKMPKMDGLEATRRIKAEYPRTTVLMVTAQEGQEYLAESVRAGAAGYVLKDAPKGQLLNAIRRALGGEFPLNQELAMRLLRQLTDEVPKEQPTASAARERRGGLPGGVSLTTREVEVLRQLALGKTNRQMAKELHLSLSTVKTHMERIISKLGVSDRTQAALKAIELGLTSE